MIKGSELKPYFETKLGKLYHGDCTEIMPELEPVDLVWTSPPYNLGRPYDEYQDDIPDQEYTNTQHAVFKLMYNLLKQDGAIFYNHKPRILNGVLDDRKRLIPFPIRQEIIWNRVGMFNFAGSFFAPSTERIFIICKDKWRPIKKYVKFGEVWRVPVVPGRDKRANHPAPFPVKLSEMVVMSSTNEEDLVLDPYFGSGTTGVACEKLNRKWLACETSEKYCEIAAERIERETQQLKISFDD